MKKLLWIIGITSLCWFASCKSVYEKQGDEHLKKGRPLKALQKYQYVLRKTSGSKNFDNSLLKAYILGMQKTVEESLDVTKLISFREKINTLMEKNSNTEIQQLYASTYTTVAKGLIDTDNAALMEIGFFLISDARAIEGLSEDISSNLNSIKADFIKMNLDKAEEHYNKFKKDDPYQGIIADYILSKMALFVDETEESKKLWSKIRKANLSTYLLYDYQNLNH